VTSISSSIQLGTNFNTPQSADSLTNENGQSITRPSGGSIVCPPGQVATSIAYLGIQTGNDSTDGLTIACRTLNPNGTLGAQSSYLSNGDFSNNPRFPSDLVTPTCASGNAISTVYWADLENNATSCRQDALDGQGIGCNAFSSTGFGTSEVETHQPTDMLPHGSQSPTAIKSLRCPNGSVAVGIEYDSFENTCSADTDATDSVVRLICAPIVSTCSGPQADLSIAKSGTPQVQQGNAVQYNITVSNNGQAAASNVIMTDTFPADLTFVSAGGAGTCSLSSPQQVTCNLGTITAGGTQSVTLNFSTPAATNSCTQRMVINTASVSTTAQEGNLGNNTASASTGITCPAPLVGCIDVLKETYDANNNPITPVAQFTFNLDGSTPIVNDAAGNARFSNVSIGSHTVSEIVQAGWTQFLVTPANGVVNVTAGTTCSAVVFKNRQNPINTDLQIQKSGPSTIQWGNGVAYTIRVANAGPAAATNVIVTDSYPTGLTYVSASGATCTTLPGNQLRCTLGTITASGIVNFTLNFTSAVPNSCTQQQLTNTATVTSDVSDTVSSNNSSSASTVMTCPPPQLGCIDITKLTFNTIGNPIVPVAQFTFNLNGGLPVNNDSAGRAHYINVPVGSYTVTEVIPTGWTQTSVSPSNGVVNVVAGNTCAAVTFQNRQNPINTDLQIQKNGPATIQWGNTVAYTINVTNNGSATATNVIVTDSYPTGLTYISASGANCSTLPGNQLRCTLGTITASGIINFTLNFSSTVPNACTQQQLTNTATVTSDVSDTNASNNTSSASTVMTCPPPQLGCIDVLKETYDANNNPLTPVAQFTFKLDGVTPVVNDAAGNARFSNVPVGSHTISEVVPAGWSQFLVTPVNGIVNVTAGSTCSAVVFKNKQNLITTDLQIQKNGPATIQWGNAVAYTINVTNNGPATATNVIVTDSYPTGLTYVSASGATCTTLPGNQLRCTLGTITASGVVTFTLNFSSTVPNACTQQQLTNTATVTSDVSDTVSSNNSSSASTVMTCPPPQLGCIDIVKETYDTIGNPLTPVAQFTFKLDGTTPVNNDSLGNARYINVPVGAHTITEVVPAGWTQFLVTPANGVVNVTAGSTCSAVVFKNRQNPINTDLQIQKNGPATIQWGNAVAYTINVTNNGPATATNVIVTDSYPTGLTYVSASGATCTTLPGNQLRCTLGTITASGVVTFTLNFSSTVPNACTQQQLTNTATVTSDVSDTVSSNNSSSASTVMTCPPPQLGCIDILKEVFDINGNPIGTVPAFTFRLDNGPTGTNNSGGILRFSNVTPGSHIVTETPQSGWNQFLVTPVNGVVNVVPGSACAGVIFKNRAVATSSSSSSSSVTNTLGCIDVYKLAYASNGTQINPTPVFTFALDGSATAQNDGTGRARFNNIPSGTHTVSEIQQGGWNQTAINPSNGTVTVVPSLNNQTCSTVIVSNQVITSSSSSSVSSSSSSSSIQTGCINIVKQSYSPQGTQLPIVPAFLFTTDNGTITAVNDSTGRAQMNNVTVGVHAVSEVIPDGWTQTSVVPAYGLVNVFGSPNNQTCQTVTFQNRQNAISSSSQSSTSSQSSSSSAIDLTITKTANPTTVSVGSTTIFTVTVYNSGPFAAQNVVVNDSLPTGLTFVNAVTTMGTFSGSQWTIGTLQSGANAVLQLTATMNVSNSVTNTATVTTSTLETNYANNSASASVSGSVQNGCIEITKTAVDNNGNNLSYIPSFTFSLDGNRTVTNDGSGRARFENVPVGTHTITEYGLSGWNMISMSPNNGTVTVVNGSCAFVSVRNQQNGNNNANLTITKTDGKSTVRPNEHLVYTIVVRNQNSTAVTNATVTDTLPNDLRVTRVSDSGIISGQSVRWTNVYVPAYSTVTFTLDADVSSNPGSNTLTNRAEVNGSVAFDTDTIEEEGENTDLDLTKTASTSEVFPGGMIEYTLTLRNSGDDTLRNIRVTDNLPSNVTVIDNGGADTNSNAQLTWRIDSLAQNATRTIRYRITVGSSYAPGSVVRNDVRATADGGIDKRASATVQVIGNLPQTGFTDGKIKASVYLQPITGETVNVMDSSTTESPMMPFFIWIALVGLATGAGAGTIRKFMFGL
jgi:uncharacterized repeat protein (TIGR01451 family)